MKALFVFHDQMWAGYNVGWSKKDWAGLRPHTISNRDLGWITYTLPPASVTSVRYQSTSDVNAKVSCSSTIWHHQQSLPFFFHFCIFSNFRGFLKFETQYSVLFSYPHLIFALTFFFPFTLWWTSRQTKLSVQDLISGLLIFFTLVHCPLVVYEHINLYLSVYRQKLCK